MIDGPGHSAGHLVIPLEETTMLKTISAALLAVAVLAAPAFAAGHAKTAPTPVIKAEQAKPVKPGVLNANAGMGHHHGHFHHHRFHNHMGALKKHQFSKVTVKHVTPASKRG